MSLEQQLAYEDGLLEKMVSLQGLMSDCDDLDSFNAAPLEAVTEFLYSDAAVVFTFEPDEVNSYAPATRAALDVNVHDLERYLDRFYYDDPILHASQSSWRAPEAKKYNVMRLSDLGGKNLRDTRYYQEFFRNTGLGDILAFSLATEDATKPPVVVAFHRAGDTRTFGRDLMARGRLLAPILSSCISRLMVSERLRLLEAATRSYTQQTKSDCSVYVFDKQMSCGVQIGDSAVDVKSLQSKIRQTCEDLSATNRSSASVFANFEFEQAENSTTLDIERTVSGFGEHFVVSMTPTSDYDPVEVAVSRWALTAREADVVREIYAGARNATIGKTLGIRLKTVENHISSIFAKVGVGSRAELISRIATRQFDTPAEYKSCAS